MDDVAAGPSSCLGVGGAVFVVAPAVAGEAGAAGAVGAVGEAGVAWARAVLVPAPLAETPADSDLPSISTRRRGSKLSPPPPP